MPAPAETPNALEAAPVPRTGPKRRIPARVFPALAVLASAVAALAVAALVGYGTAARTGRRFLPNDRAPNAYEAHVAHTIDYALGSSEPNDVLFLGDSTCTCGLRPVEFERLTGLRAYNAGTAGLVGVDGFGLILRSYLSHHPKPRLLVFCTCPWSLGVGPESTGPADIRERFLACYGPPGRGTRGPEKVGPVEQVRQGWRLLIGYACGGDRRYFDEPIPGRGGRTYNDTTRELNQSRGFQAAPGALPPDWRRPGGPADPYPVLPEFERQFDALARLARETGVPLLVRLSPVPPGPAGERYDRVRAWAARARGPGVTVGRPEVMVYDSPLFFDRIHCNPEGAAKFTALVAGEASRMLDGH